MVVYFQFVKIINFFKKFKKKLFLFKKKYLPLKTKKFTK